MARNYSQDDDRLEAEDPAEEEFETGGLETALDPSDQYEADMDLLWGVIAAELGVLA